MHSNREPPLGLQRPKSPLVDCIVDCWLCIISMVANPIRPGVFVSIATTWSSNQGESSSTSLCSLKCLNGGRCEFLSNDVNELIQFAQSGRLIERCICPEGFGGMACELDCASTQNCDDCERDSAFASAMCQTPYTEYCSGGYEQDSEMTPFCTNGGKCKSSLIAAEQAPGDFTANLVFQTEGCDCPLDFSGPHCEFYGSLDMYEGILDEMDPGSGAAEGEHGETTTTTTDNQDGDEPSNNYSTTEEIGDLDPTLEDKTSPQTEKDVVATTSSSSTGGDSSNHSSESPYLSAVAAAVGALIVFVGFFGFKKFVGSREPIDLKKSEVMALDDIDGENELALEHGNGGQPRPNTSAGSTTVLRRSPNSKRLKKRVQDEETQSHTSQTYTTLMTERTSCPGDSCELGTIRVTSKSNLNMRPLGEKSKAEHSPSAKTRSHASLSPLPEEISGVSEHVIVTGVQESQSTGTKKRRKKRMVDPTHHKKSVPKSMEVDRTDQVPSDDTDILLIPHTPSRYVPTQCCVVPQKTWTACVPNRNDSNQQSRQQVRRGGPTANRQAPRQEDGPRGGDESSTIVSKSTYTKESTPSLLSEGMYSSDTCSSLSRQCRKRQYFMSQGRKFPSRDDEDASSNSSFSEVVEDEVGPSAWGRTALHHIRRFVSKPTAESVKLPSDRDKTQEASLVPPMLPHKMRPYVNPLSSAAKSPPKSPLQTPSRRSNVDIPLEITTMVIHHSSGNETMDHSETSDLERPGEYQKEMMASALQPCYKMTTDEVNVAIALAMPSHGSTPDNHLKVQSQSLLSSISLKLQRLSSIVGPRKEPEHNNEDGLKMPSHSFTAQDESGRQVDSLPCEMIKDEPLAAPAERPKQQQPHSVATCLPPSSPNRSPKKLLYAAGASVDCLLESGGLEVSPPHTRTLVEEPSPPSVPARPQQVPLPAAYAPKVPYTYDENDFYNSPWSRHVQACREATNDADDRTHNSAGFSSLGSILRIEDDDEETLVSVAKSDLYSGCEESSGFSKVWKDGDDASEIV